MSSSEEFRQRLHAKAHKSVNVFGKGSISVEAVAAAYGELPKDHEFYGQVGRVASEWAHVEHALDVIIWELAGVPESIGACITSPMMGAANRCNAIFLLGLQRGLKEEDAALKRLNKIKGRVQGLGEDRNRVIHDPWYLEEKTKQPAQFKAMPWSEKLYGFHDVKAAGIEKLIDDVRKLRADVNDLRESIQTSLSSK